VHELSLCRAIYSIVDGARDGRAVDVVHLRVGQLRQVVPDTLRYCWDIVAQDGPLSGSLLAIDHVPVVLACSSCAATTRVEHALVLVCSACGSGDIQVVSGEEFLVTSLDLVPLLATTQEAPDG
jgi:hydrogenase nickel incorporation protein HypA/HybF